MACRFLILTALVLSFCPYAAAWGRHDLITVLALRNTSLGKKLSDTRVKAESIQKAAPDLLKRALPGVLKWCRRYHTRFDTRYAWTTPPGGNKAFGKKLSPRQDLLWQLEDNINAPLSFGATASDNPHAKRKPTFGAPGLPNHGPARSILVDFSPEPDALIDASLNRKPYLKRLRARMSLFYEGTAHTHTFRHYYVPSSLIPPLITPRGMAPYRAALYARLSIAAFKTKHPYWGYRFLAWALHYTQDMTQPWHTVFVPSLAFLSFSKAKMRHDIAAYHYLTEALADDLMLRQLQRPNRAKHNDDPKVNLTDPWFIAKIAENAAIQAHGLCARLASDSEPLFGPIVSRLNAALRPTVSSFLFGKTAFAADMLDFSGSGRGAAEFLEPLWNPHFGLPSIRRKVSNEIAGQLLKAEILSREVIEYVLRKAAILGV